jgi:hypothetical protein
VTTYVSFDNPYLDVSPTVLLAIATVLVCLLTVCLLTDRAAEWIRTHFDAGHRR